MSNDLRSRYFIKKGQTLVPGDNEAWAAFSKIKDGAGYLISITRPRNVIHHRKLWAILSVVQDNTDKWPTTETLLADLKIATGLFETRVNGVTGIPYVVAKSISFASMSQDEFEEWFNRAVDIISQQVLEMDRDDLLDAINDILAGRRAA